MRSERRAKDYFACFIALRPDAKAPHGVLALPMGNAQVPWGIICFLHNAKAAPSENEVRILLLLGRIIHNLVQRRCGERERLRLLQSLNRTQKLEAIGTLSGGIAHDFNNMLVPIIGYSDVILNHADELSGHRQKIIEIRKAAESAASLTKQLLAFSQMQILQKQSIHLNEAIERLRESLQRLVGERICLRMVLDPGLWVIEADLPQIEQVLVNVCSNARDAMPGGGEIRIGTQNVRLEAATDDEPSGNFVTLCVEDNGTGIEKDRMDRIFDPFYSSKEQPGAGLGLSVVLGIIEQHGGWIHVESEVGLGSRFLFYLPANKGVGHPGSRGTAWAEADSLLGARQPRLLVIEDEPSVLAFVTQALSRVGYDVTTASSFATALAVYERHGGRFDLVFSDVVLPDGTGMEIVDRIRARHPEQRVLLSSAYTNARTLLDRIVERRIPFLHKPYSLETLYRKVKEALQADMLVGERQRD